MSRGQPLRLRSDASVGVKRGSTGTHCVALRSAVHEGPTVTRGRAVELLLTPHQARRLADELCLRETEANKLSRGES